jgi:hypothetical protein
MGEKAEKKKALLQRSLRRTMTSKRHSGIKDPGKKREVGLIGLTDRFSGDPSESAHLAFAGR